jgi:hypothetical protein
MAIPAKQDAARRTELKGGGASVIARVPVAFALLVSCSAWAGGIQVTGTDCNGAVHLSARDARLSEVLKELGKVLAFHVNFRADHDPLVNVDMTGTPEHLVASVVRGENTSRIQILDARCGNEVRLLELWVLPGRASEAIGVRSSTSPPSSASGLAVSHYDGNYLLLTPKETRRSESENESAAAPPRR